MDPLTIILSPQESPYPKSPGLLHTYHLHELLRFSLLVRDSYFMSTIWLPRGTSLHLGACQPLF